jgi:hypothetical protein
MKDLKFVQEKWLPCPGFENSYEVSNYGKVRSIDRIHPNRRGIISGKLLLQGKNKKGYPEVKLCENNKQEARNPHRLLALAFIPNTNDLPQVNHIDGNKLNNHISNLEWISNSDNMRHAYRLGLKCSKGENNSNCKITDNQVTQIKLIYNTGKSSKYISEELDIKLHIVRQIISGKSWKTNKTPLMKRDDRSKTKKPILCVN